MQKLYLKTTIRKITYRKHEARLTGARSLITGVGSLGAGISTVALTDSSSLAVVAFLNIEAVLETLLKRNGATLGASKVVGVTSSDLEVSVELHESLRV